MAEWGKRVFIYGSCVSRDTFEFLRPRGYSLTHYAARQSLISVYGRADLALLPPFTTSSPFQRRMIEEDWRSGLVRQLRAKAAASDVILWDLCDERLGVRRLRSGGYVTRSIDLLASGLDEALKGQSDVIDFGSAEHLVLWRKRVSDWRTLLDGLGVAEKLVLMAPEWAERTLKGEPSLSSYGRTASEANAMFATYHETIEETFDCPVVRLAPGKVVSDPDHRWGPAPFHYSVENYLAMAGLIEDAAQAVGN